MLYRVHKDLGVVTISSFINFIISLALTPVMTRWYQPVDYGHFALMNNLAIFIATAFLLSLPNALPMESSWRRQAQLLRTLMHLAVISFILSLIGVALFLGVTHIMHSRQEFKWVYLSLPFLVFAITLHRIAQSWANTDGAFRSMAMARIVHPLIAKPLAIGASVLTASHAFYLIFFEAAGYLSQVIVMLRERLHKIRKLPHFFTRRRLEVTGKIIMRHRDYSLFDNLVNLLMLGSITFQSIILTQNYSPSETGLFSLAMSLTSLPVQLIALATAPVIYHRLVECARTAPALLFRKTVKILVGFSLLGFSPYFIIFMFGPSLFKIVFGNAWFQSGAVAALLSLPLFLQFVLMPISSAFRVTSTIRLQFIIDAIFTLATSGLFYFLSRTLTFLEALVGLSIVMSVHRLVVIVCCLLVAWRTSKNIAFA